MKEVVEAVAAPGCSQMLACGVDLVTHYAGLEGCHEVVLMGACFGMLVGDGCIAVDG